MCILGGMDDDFFEEEANVIEGLGEKIDILESLIMDMRRRQGGILLVVVIILGVILFS